MTLIDSTCKKKHEVDTRSKIIDRSLFIKLYAIKVGEKEMGIERDIFSFVTLSRHSAAHCVILSLSRFILRKLTLPTTR